MYLVKKALFILFCFLYLASSAGVNLNFHYCGGKLKSISFFETDEADCCGLGMEKKKNCCKEKSLNYQVKADQNSNHSAALKIELKKVDFTVVFTPVFNSYVADISYAVPDFHAPPDIGFSNTYLVNGVFRI